MHLERVTKQWLIAMKTLTKGHEKETSFRGFISMIPHNPGPILKFLPHVCSAFIQYIEEGASPELKQLFKAIMQGVKLTVEQSGCPWDEYVSEFPQEIKQFLSNKLEL